MQAETLAGLMGLAGAVVGAGVSTGAVIWQQRKAALEAERTHKLGLSEAAANGVLLITYRIEDLFADGAPPGDTPEGRVWRDDLKILLRDLHSEALRFHDEQVRRLVQWGHAEILRDPEGVAQGVGSGQAARYRDICTHLQTAMGAVLRREPFPDDVRDALLDAGPSRR
ncbi:hypothetical protein [Streptomyces adustus]